MTSDSPKKPLIRALRDMCKASFELEKLDDDIKLTRQVFDSARDSYRQLMEDTPSALLLIDQEGKVLSSNRASQVLLGYTAEELQRINVGELYQEENEQAFRLAFRQILEEGAGSVAGLSASRKDGQGILVDTLFLVVAYDDESVVQVTLKEAEDRHKAQLDERRYLMGLELLSRTAIELFDLSPGENLYKRLGDYVIGLVGDGYAIVSSFDKPSQMFSVEAVCGPERHAEILLGVLLRHLVGVSFRISHDEFDQYVSSCAPVSVSGGLHGLFVDRLPKDVYVAMQDFFLFGCTYVAGLTSAGEVFGMTTILMPKGAKLDHPQLVAKLMEQGSVALKHRRREHSHQAPIQSQPLIQELQTELGGSVLTENILAEELPYPVEQYSAEQRPSEERPSEEQAAAEVNQDEAETSYKDLRYLLMYKKILVVDHEERVRDVTGGLLSYMGCKVGFAKNGSEAITQYKRVLGSAEAYDAIILDTSLSGDLNFESTMAKFREVHPKVKVIASASLPAETVTARFKDLGVRAVLSKPYRCSHVGEVLKKVLSETG